MTPDTEMINKLISHLREVGGDHFYMSKFAARAGTRRPYPVRSYKPCKTAFCVAGWANALSIPEDELASMDSTKFSNFIDDTCNASRLLHLTDDQANKLFYMEGTRDIDMRSFDKLPHNYRLDAGIRVLELLRDKHVVDWDRAVRETVPKQVVDSAFYSVYEYLPEREDSEQHY